MWFEQINIHFFFFAGKKTAQEALSESKENSNNLSNSSFLGRKDSFNHLESSSKLDSSFYENKKEKNSSIIEKESTSFNLEDSILNNNRTYSTTLNTQVKAAPSPSNGMNSSNGLKMNSSSNGLNMNSSTNGLKEESFLIRTDQEKTGLNSFRIERESSKGYFGKESSRSSIFSKEKETSMMDELSKNPLFNMNRDRSQSPRERSKSPENSTFSR